MRELLARTIEFQNWGMNVLTFSFLATLFFNAFQFWGFYKQNQTIWRNRSGLSVSLLLFSYYTAFFLAFLVYGLQNASIAIITGGISGFMCLPIFIGLYKFKDTQIWEKVVAFSLFLIIPIMAVTSRKDALLSVLLGVAGLFLLHQLHEIWATKKSGSVDPRMISVFVASTMFWTVYSVSIGNLVLGIFNPFACVIYSTILFLWFKYRAVANIAAAE